MRTKKQGDWYIREDGVRMMVDDVGRCGRIYFDIPQNLTPNTPHGFLTPTEDFPTGGRGYITDAEEKTFRRQFALGQMPQIPHLTDDEWKKMK